MISVEAAKEIIVMAFAFGLLLGALANHFVESLIREMAHPKKQE